MKRILIVLTIISTISCSHSKKEEKAVTSNTEEKNEKIPIESNGGIGDGAISISDHFVNNIEKAHKKDKFFSHPIVSFSLSLTFGGVERLQSKITMLTNSSKIRIDKNDDSKLIYNGDTVYLCPANASDKGARFDMFTWTYFFGLPYKLDDPGTIWEMQKDRMLDEVTHATAKLSFEKGTGDAPDDWYVIYADPNTNILKAAAYIVTFGNTGDISEATANPHAIYYKDFKTVDGVPFATTWEFYGWSADNGMTDKIGEATISDITFLDEEGALFDKPENSKIIQ